MARVHRDPFEPILPILEADSPLAEYRKITDELVRRMPDARRYLDCIGAVRCSRSVAGSTSARWRVASGPGPPCLSEAC